MKIVPLLVSAILCALIAAAATWFVLQGSRIDAPRSTQNVAARDAASEELQQKNDALREEKERLERENATLKRTLDEKNAREAESKTHTEKPATGIPGDTTAKPTDKPVEKPAEPAPENPAMKATRDAAIADFKGSDQGAQDDAMKLLANLAKNGDAEARKVLLAALKSEDAYVRELAVEALGIMANPEDMALLEAASKDPERKVREEAADALGNLPADKAGPLLVAMLADADPRVVRTAADRLGDLKWEGAKNDLVRLAGGADENVAIEAAVALRRMGDTSAAENLVPAWGAKSKSTDANERMNAVKQLRRMRLESTRIYLEALANDENSRVRDEAKKALKQLDKDAGK